MPLLGKCQPSMNVVHRQWGECRWDSNSIMQNFVNVTSLSTALKRINSTKEPWLLSTKEKTCDNLHCHFPMCFLWRQNYIYVLLCQFTISDKSKHKFTIFFDSELTMLFLLSYNHTQHKYTCSFCCETQNLTYPLSRLARCHICLHGEKPKLSAHTASIGNINEHSYIIPLYIERKHKGEKLNICSSVLALSVLPEACMWTSTQCCSENVLKTTVLNT